ncbi:MAG: NCS2 family permease [Schwartzia sp.]|nr:NCS2 family permease [Schwartzia sp. (in: firmicutes)]
MEKWFAFEERRTNFRTEIIAGVTTFLSMLYIVIVNSTTYSQGGMDFGGVYLATIIATMIATLIMGIVANYPIAIAPGIGINAYLVYTVIISQGVPWQDALGLACTASAIFIALSVSRFRQMLIDSIPESLKAAMGAGIGLFIALIGLVNGHLVMPSPATLVTLGSFSDPTAYLTVLGLVVTMGLMVMRINSAIFLGMIFTAVVAYAQGFLELPATPFALPSGLNQTFMGLRFDSVTVFPMVVFTLLLVTLFDTTGTMLGVGRQAGIIRDGKFPNLQSALLADSIGSFIGAFVGTGPTSAYVESGTGVAAGGRTGFASVVTAALFLLLVFCEPLAKSISAVAAISAPALILVGAFMMDSLRDIDWLDSTESFPAFFTAILMPMTYSIANGVGIGFILYALLKTLSGKWREVHPLMYLLAVMFIIQLAFS